MSKKLIDAEETIRNIIIAAPREPDEAIRATASAIVVIENMPPAQPERGHWFNPLGDFAPYRCSRCGHYSDSKTPFCAHCGAAMREEKNVHYDNHSS